MKNTDSNRVKFHDFIKYLDDSSTYNYTKQEYKQSIDLFDQDKIGVPDVDDIKRVLSTYSNLEEVEIEHFL